MKKFIYDMKVKIDHYVFTMTDFDFSECPKGLECKMVMESHFWSYRHTIQAHINSRTPPSGNMAVCSRNTGGSSKEVRNQHQIVDGRHLQQKQQQISSKRSPSEDSGYGDQNVMPGPSGLQKNHFRYSSMDKFPSKRPNVDNNLLEDSDEEESEVVNSDLLFDNLPDLFDQNANKPWQDHRKDKEIADKSKDYNIRDSLSLDSKDKICGGDVNKNGYRGAKCSSSSDRQHSSSTAATKDARVNVDSEILKTPFNSRKIISEVPSSKQNTAEKIITKNTAKDFSADFDLPDIPDLELESVLLSSSTNISDTGSGDRTILFTGSPCIQRVESEGNPVIFNGESTQNFVELLRENRNVKFPSTASLDDTGDKFATTVISSSPTESYSSHSLLKNVSRNLFKNKSTHEYLVSGGGAQDKVSESTEEKTLIMKQERLPDTGTHKSSDAKPAQECGHKSTESLKLTLEREWLSEDSSSLSLSRNAHIQIIGKEKPGLAETSSGVSREGNIVSVKSTKSSQPVQEDEDDSRREGICDTVPLANSTKLSHKTVHENELLPASRDNRIEDSESETDVENIRRCRTDKTDLTEGGSSGSGGSETHKQDKAAVDVGNLEDSDEDEVLVSLVEAAVEKYFGNVVDRVREKKRGSRTSNWDSKRESCTPTTMDHKQGVVSGSSGVVGELDNSGDGQCECKCSGHNAIHLHLHLNTPSPKKGQFHHMSTVVCLFI